MTLKENLKHLDDAHLVQEFWGGNIAAFDVFVARHTTHIAVFVHRLLYNPALEKDVMQNVWQRVFLSLRRHAYRETGHFLKWINTIAYHEAMKMLKSESSYIHNQNEDAPDEEASASENDAAQEETVKQAKQALLAMNAQVQEIVRLRIEEGKHFDEIATIMHSSRANVIVIFWRAMKRLKKLLKTPFRNL